MLSTLNNHAPPVFNSSLNYTLCTCFYNNNDGMIKLIHMQSCWASAHQLYRFTHYSLVYYATCKENLIHDIHQVISSMPAMLVNSVLNNIGC